MALEATKVRISAKIFRPERIERIIRSGIKDVSGLAASPPLRPFLKLCYFSPKKKKKGFKLSASVLNWAVIGHRLGRARSRACRPDVVFSLASVDFLSFKTSSDRAVRSGA